MYSQMLCKFTQTHTHTRIKMFNILQAKNVDGIQCNHFVFFNKHKVMIFKRCPVVWFCESWRIGYFRLLYLFWSRGISQGSSVSSPLGLSSEAHWNNVWISGRSFSWWGGTELWWSCRIRTRTPCAHTAPAGLLDQDSVCGRCRSCSPASCILNQTHI